ncbi:MAG: chromate transporter [Bryobacteraceae bacterium]
MIGMRTETPKLHDVATVFARFGNFTFGGGSATIAVLRDEIVAKRAWMTTLNADLSFALSRLTPGTNLLAFCTAVGWLLRGWRGAVVALVAGSVPSSVLAVLVTALYEHWSHNPFMKLALSGALAAAIGVMIITGWTSIRPYYRQASWPQLALFIGVAFGLSYFLSVSPLRILLLSAIVGLFWPQRRGA